MSTENSTNLTLIDKMFKAGAHFGFNRSRRHPSITPYIFGTKNKVEILDLEKTESLLQKAKTFVEKLGSEDKTILFVGGKSEAKSSIRKAGQTLVMPYVDGRWIGGTLTNFPEIKKRVERMEKLISEKEKGELAKYTKKERLMIDREISNLEDMFFGISVMKKMPDAIFVIDPKKEAIAVKEAKDKKVPVIALLGSDCNLNQVEYPIVGNDASRSSVEFFVQEIINAFEAGKLKKSKEKKA